MDHILSATNRIETGKALAKFRRAGKIPANIFQKHNDSSQIWVTATDLKKIMQTSNEGSLLYIQMTDSKTKRPTILRHIDYSVPAGIPTHATFQEVSLKEEVTVEIDIEIVGEALAVKAGHVIETPITTIEIKALPTALPEKIEVDITKLETLDDKITAADVILPKGVSMVTDPEAVLIAVVSPTVEVIEATTASEAEAVAAVETTEDKKEEDSK